MFRVAHYRCSEKNGGYKKPNKTVEVESYQQLLVKLKCRRPHSSKNSPMSLGIVLESSRIIARVEFCFKVEGRRNCFGKVHGLRKLAWSSNFIIQIGADAMP